MTAATVIYKDNNNGLFYSVYIWKDGDLETFGPLLLRFFNSYDDAKHIINHGNISTINQDGTIEAYANMGQTYAKNAPKENKKVNHLSDNDYNYLFVEDTWFIKQRMPMGPGSEWKNLSRFFPDEGGFTRGGDPYKKMKIGSSRDREYVAESYKEFMNK